MDKFHNYSHLHLEVKKGRSFVFIKDPLHNEIIFSEDQLWLYELINTYEFQRLHRIKQLGFTYLNFPSAIHTRFIHCLGTYHLCNQFISQFIYNKELCPNKDRYEINIALASALLHDIGHGPFSHVFEKAWNFSHEFITSKILFDKRTKINYLLRKKALKDNLSEDFYISEISKVINKTSKYHWIVSLISSEIDIDRLDYISRDSHFTGLLYGNIDLTILIKWAVLKEINGEKNFLFLDKAQYVIYNFLISRQYMYLELYDNKVSAFYETLLIMMIKEFKKVYKSLTDEEKKLYESIKFLMSDANSWDVLDFLFLNDDSFMQIINHFSKSTSSKLRNLANLFLCYNNKTNIKVNFLSEQQVLKYKEFIKKFPNSSDFLSENIYETKANISESIFLWNSELQIKQEFNLKLTQKRRPSLFLLFMEKDRYEEWKKYTDNI